MYDEDRAWDIKRGEAEEAYRESKAEERWDIVHRVTEAAGFDDYYSNGFDIWGEGEMGEYVLNDYFLETACNKEFDAEYIREVMMEDYCELVAARYKPKGINQ